MYLFSAIYVRCRHVVRFTGRFTLADLGLGGGGGGGGGAEYGNHRLRHCLTYVLRMIQMLLPANIAPQRKFLKVRPKTNSDSIRKKWKIDEAILPLLLCQWMEPYIL